MQRNANNYDLTFDSVKHEYSVDGVVIPSVTQIVNRVIPRQHYAEEWYLRRGEMVHRAIALLLSGMLDESTLDPRISGHVAAAKKAIQEHIPSAIMSADAEIECRNYHQIMRYAGTPDLYYHGQLWDWKCGNDPQTEIQLGGYVALIEMRKLDVIKCVAVVLDEAGTYSMTHYKPARCKALFMAAYTLYGWLKSQ